MPISYNPGVVDQSGQILAQGINDFMKRQKEAAKEADQLQYQAQKSDMIVGHAYKNQQITPEQWKEYLTMAPKKKVAFGDGLGANMASDMIQQKYRMEQEGQNYINMQRGAQIGMINAQAAAYPETQRLNNAQTRAQIGMTNTQNALYPAAQAANNAAQLGQAAQSIANAERMSQPVAVPKKANTSETLPNGQIAFYNEKGEVTRLSAPTKEAMAPDYKKIDEELQAATGASFYAHQNAINKKINPDGSYEAEIPVMDKDGNPVIEQRPVVGPDGKQAEGWFGIDQTQKVPKTTKIKMSKKQYDYFTEKQHGLMAKATESNAIVMAEHRKAQEFIAKGADPEAVKAMLEDNLKKLGVHPTGTGISP